MIELSVQCNGLSEMCRLCLTEDTTDSVDIHSFSIDFNSKLSKVIMDCAPVEIHPADKLPSIICDWCYRRLHYFSEFQKKAVSSQKILHQYLQKLGDSNSKINASILSQSIKNEPSAVIDQHYEYSSSECSDYDDTEICQYNNIQSNEILQIIGVNSFSATLSSLPDIDTFQSNNNCNSLQNKKTDPVCDGNSRLEPSVRLTRLSLQDTDLGIGEQSELDLAAEGNQKLKSRYKYSPNQKTNSSRQNHTPTSDQSDVYKKGKNLTVHKSTHTGKKPSKNALVVREQNYVKKKRLRCCNVCNKSLSSLASLYRHKRIHTGEKPYQCDVCNRKFLSKQNMISHKSKHTDEKRYQCHVCNHFYAQESSLVVHKRVHTDVTLYSCDVCKKKFAGNDAFVSHMRSCTEKKRYQCDVCDKFLTSSRRLMDHKHKHNGVKPYQCDACNREFSVKNSMMSHKWIHSNGKLYQCDVCNHFYANESSLILHKRIHTDLSCDICNRKFMSKNALILHRRSCSEKKYFQCDLCYKFFSSSKNLVCHKRIHNDIKPYTCNICNKKFVNKRSMWGHQHIHRREKS